MTKVLLVEDQAGLRNVVRLLLEDGPDIEVVGEAGGGADVGELVRSLRPDAVVLDLGLPDVDGEQVLAQLRRDEPGVRVVVLSGQASAIIAGSLREAGAAAVVEKGVYGWEAELLAALAT